MTEAWTYNPQPPRPDWGVRAPALKSAATGTIVVAPLPAQVVLPLGGGASQPAEPLVAVGERVCTGQPVARTASGTLVRSSITGRVIALEERAVPAREPASAPCIVVRREDPEEWHADCRPVPAPLELAPEEIRARIAQAGIVGLGGALFSTAVKLTSEKHVHALIVNGAECEPWIACDEMLLRERAELVLAGARIMMRALHTDHAVIAIESDMPEARVALHDALDKAPDNRFGIAVVTAKYPAGGERQLIELVTGQEVPSGGLPRDIGYVCHNVGTAAAVAELFLHGRPPVARIVTVTGGAIERPGNFEARLGTPIRELVELAGGYRSSPGLLPASSPASSPGSSPASATGSSTDASIGSATGSSADAAPHRLLMGGPMMGFALPSDDLPITPATNCVVAAGPDEIAPPRPEMPCIRCGECVQVCPARLMPNELHNAARKGDVPVLQELGLVDCIECGCCDYVCPSNIPLTARFVAAKTAQRAPLGAPAIHSMP